MHFLIAYTTVHWNYQMLLLLLFFVCFNSQRRGGAIVRCVCGKPILRIKGVMFSLRQLKMVALLGTWDPCLSAGIGVEPAASLRARCCFIYLKAQVTFLEERRWETSLRGLSASLSLLSHTFLWRMRLRAISRVSLQNVTKTDQTWTFTFCLTVKLSSSLSVKLYMNASHWEAPFESSEEVFFFSGRKWSQCLNVKYDSLQDRMLMNTVSESCRTFSKHSLHFIL